MSLPPLSKVRCCRPKKFGRLPEGLPLHHPFQNRTIPRLALNLPPLSKGGGLTARHKLLLCCVLLAICPPFLCYKLFCRQDGGIVTPSPLLKTTLIPRNLPTPLPLNECSGSAILQKKLSVAFYHSQN